MQTINNVLLGGAVLLLASCGQPVERGFDELPEAVSLMDGWSLGTRSDVPEDQVETLPENTLVVRRDQPVTLLSGQSVRVYHLVIPFAGEMTPDALEQMKKQNASNAEKRERAASENGLNAIPVDPVSGKRLPRDEIEQEKVKAYELAVHGLVDHPLPTHRFGEDAVTWVPFEWTGRADDRSLYTESTQQAMRIQNLLVKIP